jgi:hypothetical protein
VPNDGDSPVVRVDSPNVVVQVGVMWDVIGNLEVT